MQPESIDRILTSRAHNALDRLRVVKEDQWFERKSGRISARDLAVPLIAMANAEGGYVVAGLSDGTVDGVAQDALNALRQTVFDFTDPVVRCATTELDEVRARLSKVLVTSWTFSGWRTGPSAPDRWQSWRTSRARRHHVIYRLCVRTCW